MGSIGDNITQQIPAVGTAGTAYATQINAFLEEVKVRLQANIPMTSLLLGDFNLQNNALLNASYLSLVDQGAAPTTPVGSYHTYNGNAYFVGSAGAVQITDGANLNIAATGGITGDYGGGNPAQFRFVDADKTYYAYDNFAATELGYLRGLGMEIAPAASSALRLRLAWGGALNYTFTFPPAVPASAALLQMSAAGAVTASSSLATSITLTGTADYKHGDKTIAQELSSTTQRVISGTSAAPAAGNIGAIVSATSVVKFPLFGIKDGDRIKSVQVFHGGSAANVTFQLNSNAGTSFTAINNSIASMVSPTTVTVAAPAAAAGVPYYLSVTTGAATCSVYRCIITYDRP